MKQYLFSRDWVFQFSFWSVTLFFVFSMQACLLLVGAGARTGGAAFVMGKLDAELDGSVKKVHGATIAGLKSLNIQT